MNIHTLHEETNNSNNNNANSQNMQGYSIPAENNESNSDSDNQIMYRQKKSCKTFCFVILMVDFSIYLAQILVFKYKYDSKNWSCLLYKFGAKYTPAIQAEYQYYRLFTPMLLHASIGHIISNSLSILFIGFYVESIITTRLFIPFYFLAGLTGNLMSAVFNRKSLSVGASTCGMGVSGLLLIQYATRLGRMTNDGIIDFLIYGAITLANAFNIKPDIDCYGHIGGFIFGLAASIWLLENRGLSNILGLGCIKKLKIISLAVIASIYVIGLGYLFYTQVPKGVPSKIC